MKILLACLTVLATLSLPVQVDAQRRTLLEPQTGMTLEAPRRFRVVHRDGFYVLRRGRQIRARFVIGRTPLNAKMTAEDYIEQTSLRVRRFIEQGDAVLLRARMRRRPVQIRFRPVGPGLMEVILYASNPPPVRRTARAVNSSQPPTARITAAQVRILDRIIQSRQGGRVVPLPVQIPMRQATGPGTSALVPNLPGWSFALNDGIVSGGHPTQGIVNLGIPSLSFGLQDPRQAIFVLWPQLMQNNGAQVQVLGVQFIPNTGGWLGGNFSSGLFAVRFRFNNRNWDALFVSGIAPATNLWYHSYIGVPVGSSPAIGNALMNTWATWDPSGASQQRLQQALNTILTTVVPGNPIDPEVFDRIHERWVNYIRS